jgi:SAM-dependent methyltransferase
VTAGVKLNLGCGKQVVDGWLNVDYSLGARMAKVPMFRQVNRHLRLFKMEWDSRIFLHNLCEPFPWESGTVDCVYSSHTLEHMSRAEGESFLSECKRVVKPGGVVRIVVPSLRAFIDDYLQGRTPADRFLEHIGVLYDDSGRGLKKLVKTSIQYPHKCMYDDAALIGAFARVGLEARARGPFDSDIGNITDIELAERTVDAVIVEAVKN